MSWQPIETAPKDGSCFLLWRPYPGRASLLQFSVGRWCSDKYAKKPRPYWSSQDEAIHGKRWAIDYQPTHWMPLLPPPGSES